MHRTYRFNLKRPGVSEIGYLEEYPPEGIHFAWFKEGIP